MGLLDNLFKPKPEAGAEKSVENTSGEGVAEPAASPKLSPFLAPKIYVPRSSVQIVPPARTPPQGERKLAPVAGPSAAPKEIVLSLGDVLSRLPAHFLREGKPDLRRELRFPAEGLAADIAHGRASVYLADIVAQCPDLFLPEVEGFDDIQIRLPLQKLVEQIALGAGNRPPVSTPAVAEKPPTPPPASPAPAATEEEVQIHLSLAVILRRCPREIIVQPLPPIEEAVRITFPFAPIERQLSTGQVEVSSLRFIAALPLGLMRCFEARAGVKVPLPLEEIFQNLPHRMPHAGVEMPPPAPAAPAEKTNRARENARLAESILLEPVFEPVALAEPPPSAPGPAVAENVVIAATFTHQPSFMAAPEIRGPIFTAPPEPKKTEAAVELAAQLEALAQEDAKIESRLAEESLLAPLPVPPLEETAPEILPDSKPPMAETPADLSSPASEPAAPPTGFSAFRPFAPPLRPPVILQPNSGREELRAAPTGAMPVNPVPTPAPEPTPEIVAPAPPVASPAEIAPEPALISPEIPTAISVPAASMLHIAPPQFRPFVVHAPLIVLALKEDAAFSPELRAPEPASPEPVAARPTLVAAQPEIAETLAEFPPETDDRPVNVEPPPAPPFLLDGRVREFFPDDAPLSLPRVSQLLAALPGIHGCVLITRSAESHSGEIPAGLDPASIRELSQRLRGAMADRAEIFGPGEMQHLTLHAEQYSLSLFSRGEACACAIHRTRIFLPGVREKFAAAAEELARVSR